MAKLVILTLELQEARALLERLNCKEKDPQEMNQYVGLTRNAINKLEKAVKRASLGEGTLA